MAASNLPCESLYNVLLIQVSGKGLHVHITPRARGFVPLMCVSNDIKVNKNTMNKMVLSRQLFG